MTEFKIEPERLTEVVRFGIAELVPDPDRPGSWAVRMDGVAQSYVDLGDPRRLVAEYAQQVAAVTDAMAEPGSALRVLHLGGGGLTLPRYVAATRPGSAQVVVEHDDLLLEFVLRVLPLDPQVEAEFLIADARGTVESFPDSAFDLIIADVAETAQMPSSVATAACAAEIGRILRPGGIYLVNVPDLPDLTFARRVGATLLAVFGEVCAIKEPAAQPGRRYANAVFAAAHRPGTLPLAALPGASYGPALAGFLDGARPLTDEASLAGTGDLGEIAV